MALTLRPRRVSAAWCDTNRTQAREDQGPKGYTALSPSAPGCLDSVYVGQSKTRLSDFIGFFPFSLFCPPGIYIFFFFLKVVRSLTKSV